MLTPSMECLRYVKQEDQSIEWMTKGQAMALRVNVVSSPDRFFPFLFVVAEKRVWWISVGRFVLQTPRFWESLIGVDNYKGLFDEVSITIVTCSYVIK